VTPEESAVELRHQRVVIDEEDVLHQGWTLSRSRVTAEGIGPRPLTKQSISAPNRFVPNCIGGEQSSCP
jgi:hypothetical protein